MLNKQRAYEIIDLITGNTTYYAAVEIMSSDEGLTRFANSEIHQNVYNADTVVRLTVFDGKKISIVSTNILNDQGLLQALRDAEDKLAFLPESPHAIPELMDSPEIVEETYNQALNDAYGTLRRAELLKEAMEEVDADCSASGILSLENMFIAWGNTKGVKRYVSRSGLKLNVLITHESGASGYVEVSAGKPEEMDVVAAFKNVAERAKMAMNPVSIEPGKYDVILEPLAVGSLLMFSGYVGANSRFHQMGVSCFAGKMGDKVFGENITIYDDHKHEATATLPFDFEGHPRQPMTFIENGVLKGITYDTITALAEGKETTGHSVGYEGEGGIPLHLVMEPGDSSVEEMIASTEKGLLVTRFHYTNIVDPRKGMLTGLTRDGVFLIEDGKIKSPVYNLRFTDSIENVFNNVEALSSKREKAPSFFGSSYVPAVKVKNFAFTGKTQIEE